MDRPGQQQPAGGHKAALQLLGILENLLLLCRGSGILDSRPFFKQHTGVPIPLRVLPRASVHRWEAEIAQEIATPFAPGQAPLLRAVLVYEPDHSILILAGCHSIVDGTTLPFLFRDILSAMAGQPLEPLSFPRSAEELLGLKAVAPQHSGGEQDDLSTAPENNAGVPTVSTLQLSAPSRRGSYLLRESTA